nr:FAD-dependent oxidoreductase [Saprospiraceae bacterium]
PENEIRLEEECFKLFKNKPLQKTFLTGVRPTTPDRRPFLGQSSDQPGLFILNGLGTKGLSLAPYLSKVLIQWMDFGIMPPPEIVASRFLKGS